MEFSFGKKIKELRFAKDVTQDQLAKHLMISPQAVSKWERETGYPDIMMLPRIEYLKAFLEWAKGSEKEKHTSLLLNRLEMTRRYTNTSGRPMSTQTMEDIKRQCYDPYREDPEFIRIKSELEAIHNEEINK